MSEIIKNPEPPRPQMRLWLRILLGVSLALNLLVVGLVGGAMWRFGGPDGTRPPPRTIGAALYRALPREDRRALLAQSRGKFPGVRDGRRKAGIQAVSAALRATPFDADAVMAILEAQAAARDDLQKSLQRAWLVRVGAMSAEQRRLYADRLERGQERRWFKRRRR